MHNKEQTPSASLPQDLGWINELALEELRLEESGVIEFDDHLNPEKYLEASSLQLMAELKELFQKYVEQFNQARNKKGAASAVRIFKISNTPCDFMLFRNSLKLVVSRSSNSLISIGFLSNSGGLFSARLNHNQPASNAPHQVQAHLGPFNKITWKFEGEPVDLTILVRHYLTEFIKHSAH